MGVSESCGDQDRAFCVPYEESTSPNESHVYINSIRITENGGLPISTFRKQPNSYTLTDIIETSARMYKNLSCVGERNVDSEGNYGEYLWITYNEFYHKCLDFAAGLQSIAGIQKGDTVGICSRSCIAWQISFFALLFIGAVPVTVYESFGPENSRYIIKHSKCKSLIVHSSNSSFTSELIGSSSSSSENNGNNPINTNDNVNANDNNNTLDINPNDENNNNNNNNKKTKDDENECTLMNVIVIAKKTSPDHFFLSMEELIEKGHDIRLCGKNGEFVSYRPVPDDTAIVMFTSGSAGVPKGCVLSHKNLVSGATGLTSAGTSMGSKDTYFSYLPLAHIYELCCQLIMLAHGVRIGFFSGDPRDIYRDCKVLQPTVMSGVPRIFNRLVDMINHSLDKMHPFLKMITLWAMDLKRQAALERQNHSLFLDLLFLNKFREELGGKLRIMVIGGAPILPEIFELLRSTITLNIIQGYGLTEISAAGCVSDVMNVNPASVGPVSIASDMKFRRVEGMDYDPKSELNPSGELMFRGPSIFKGYLFDEESTKESFDGEWYLTGDVGLLNTEGHIQIIDRVKQLVKLSHGEYISLSNLAELYSSTQSAKYVYVFADSHHNQPVALVIPTKNCIDDWSGRGITSFQTSEIAKLEMLKNLNETAEKLKMKGFEKLFDIILENDILSVENGLLTPSMKPHFHELRAKYEARLLELYANNQPPSF